MTFDGLFAKPGGRALLELQVNSARKEWKPPELHFYLLKSLTFVTRRAFRN